MEKNYPWPEDALEPIPKWGTKKVVASQVSVVDVGSDEETAVDDGDASEYGSDEDEVIVDEEAPPTRAKVQEELEELEADWEDEEDIDDNI